jgi:uncharacterized protein DUF4386
VTLRQHLAGVAGTDAASFVTVGKALVAVHDWTFLLGPNFVLGTNTTLLVYLMYRSGLVPTLIAVLGLVGGPLIFASAIAELFGLYKQVSVWGPRGGPGGRLGVDACHLADRQGIQALCWRDGRRLAWGGR